MKGNYVPMDDLEKMEQETDRREDASIDDTPAPETPADLPKEESPDEGAPGTDQAATWPEETGEDAPAEAGEALPGAPEAQAELTGIEEGIEPFVPSDYYHHKQPTRKGKRRSKKKKRSILGLVILLTAAALLAAVGLYGYKVLHNPGSFFGTQAAVPTPTAPVTVDAAEDLNTPTPVPTPTPTLDPYHQLLAGADQTMMQNIINVLVIGVDYAEERETWHGKHAYHADVMMVLAINFDENRVDLISLPRDTYAKIPGVKGIYKLNASLDCGGGMDAANGAGFLKVCEAASWMLGGIPVNYYYAVTMPAVKQLVDAVGGVDYDLEISYTMMGRRYRKGEQHMDGQGVLDYLRVRKNVADPGDWNRVDRQKKMMVALFESMQQQNLILKIPEIVSSFDGQMYTNCTASQTAALASFAYGLSKENIGMYSMGGTMKNIFNWNFCITDQEKRVEIIKNVYGLDVPQEKEYNMAFAQYRWAEMRAQRYLDRCEGLTKFVRAAIAEDDLLPEYVPEYNYDPGYVDPGYVDPGVIGGGSPGGFEDIPVITAAPMSSLAGAGYAVENLWAHSPALGSPYRQYSAEDRDLFSSYRATVDDVEDARTRANKEVEKYLADEDNSFKGASSSYASAVNNLASLGASLANRFGYSISWNMNYEKDTDFNEITVDFN